MKDWNTCFAYLNMELPDDIRRLKEAGYYNAAIARIDACLAEDWTASQNQPLHPQGALPVNPTPHGVDAWRQGLLAHREILRRLPQDYTLTAEQLLNRLQATLRDFTAEEFAALDAAGQMDWRFVEGQKRYIYRAAETLVATHPDLAARQLDPPVPERSWDRFEPQHDQMVRTGAVSADITLRTSIGMTDETFARALAAAKAEGRDTVHVKVWLPLPAACPAQSNITLDSFTVQPTYIAPETAPQRTAYWETDLAENCRFGAQYSYRRTAPYAAPQELPADPVQEVLTAKDILKAAGLRRDGVNIIACPTCGRTRIDLIRLANEVEQALSDCQKPITVAVMGCVVNGPGEAREADVGIAGGDGCGILFVKGRQLKKLPYDELLPALLAYIGTL